MHQITLITIPVCPKCKMMRKRLEKLAQNYPEISVEEMGLKSYLGEAFKRKIMDAPILLVGEEVFTGIVDDSTILSALELKV